MFDALAQSGGSGNLRPVIALVAGFLALIVIAIVIAARRRRRTHALNEGVDGDEHALAAFEPFDPVEAGLRERYADLPTLNKMRGKVTKALRGSLDDRRAIVFEHTYTTMAGSTPVVMKQTVFACEAPDWPTVKIAPRRLFSRIAMRFGRVSGIQLDNAAFNAAFWVGSDDEPFAVTLLSPEMQAFLLSKPNVRWRSRNRELCLIHQGGLRVKRAGASLERLRRFWALTPPELAEWKRLRGEAPIGAAP